VTQFHFCEFCRKEFFNSHADSVNQPFFRGSNTVELRVNSRGKSMGTTREWLSVLVSGGLFGGMMAWSTARNQGTANPEKLRAR
jgi:hypothetical protein